MAFLFLNKASEEGKIEVDTVPQGGKLAKSIEMTGVNTYVNRETQRAHLTENDVESEKLSLPPITEDGILKANAPVKNEVAQNWEVKNT